MPSAFRQATEEVGKWVGQSGRSLVYGGSGVGMMEVLAQSAKQAGARIFGIVPQFVVDRNAVSDTLDVDIRTAGLADRKTILIERSDLMIALPGGVGTLDEIFTLMGRNHHRWHAKTPCIVQCGGMLEQTCGTLGRNGGNKSGASDGAQQGARRRKYRTT